MKCDIIEITRVQDGSDRDGTYYSTVDGAPEYVPYNKLRSHLSLLTRAWIPELHELSFRDCGSKAYAYIHTVA